MRSSKLLFLTLSLTASAHAQETRPDDVSPIPSTFWWGDFDGDGREDAFVLQADGSHRLLANRGDGGFEDATLRTGVGAHVRHDLRQAAWADYDADGRLDLFLVAGEESRLLRQDASGTFADATAASGLDPEAKVRAVRWLDYDGDGYPDLQVHDGESELLYRNEDGLFSPVERGSRPTTEPDATLAWLAAAELDPLALLEGLAALSAPAAERGSAEGALAAGSADGSGTVLGPREEAGAFCAPRIADATGSCLEASSTPTLGMLYPLSSNWYVDAISGHVGIGTIAPSQRLDVQGMIRSSAGFVFPDGTTQTTAQLVGPAGPQGPPGLLIGGGSAQTARHDGTTWVADGNLVNNGTRVGVGQSSPATRLDVRAVQTTDLSAVRAEGWITGTFGYLGIQGQEDFDGFTSADWSGLEVGAAGISTGSSSGDNYGLMGHSNGAGVRGEHSSDPVNDFGELGREGVGVYGNGTEIGVEGFSDTVLGIGVKGTGDIYGVYADHAQTYGGALFADATATFGPTWGVRAENESTSGVALDGEAYATTGTTYGVRGEVHSTDGIAVRGENLHTTAGIGVEGEGKTYGVRGVSSSTAVRGDVTGSAFATGVSGRTNAGYGVYGEAVSSSGTNYGVYGRAAGQFGRGLYGSATHATGINYGVRGITSSPNGFGVYSFGDSGASGTKSFLQPDPGDPSRQIRYYCLEGNEAGTYFRGSARLENGVATISVPESFRLASSEDGLTVQLTAMGPGAGLWVEHKDLSLVVVRGAGDVAFDYQVNGLRRGYEEVPDLEPNTAFVPEVRGVPYGTQFPAAFRRILVENGTLNADFTPNEATARRLGWTLRDPEDERELR